jgi:16S rRNA processing protein RimM
VGRPHGVRGAFLVDGAVDWFAYAAGSALLLDGEERRIRERGESGGRPLVQLEGVDDRDAAAALRGAQLELDAAELPEPEPDAFYVFDLVGCDAFCGARLVGRVRDVLERPANDVLVVEPAGGGELLVPFIREAVPSVDVAARRLELAEAFCETEPA